MSSKFMFENSKREVFSAFATFMRKANRGYLKRYFFAIGKAPTDMLINVEKVYESFKAKSKVVVNETVDKAVIRSLYTVLNTFENGPKKSLTEIEAAVIKCWNQSMNYQFNELSR